MFLDYRRWQPNSGGRWRELALRRMGLTVEHVGMKLLPVVQVHEFCAAFRPCMSPDFAGLQPRKVAGRALSEERLNTSSIGVCTGRAGIVTFTSAET
jgi:hypothetical protein